MELKDCFELIVSPNFKDRLKGEYLELKIRHDKLETMLSNWDNLEFEPNCPKELLEQQLRVMKEYRDILVERIKIES